MEDASARRAMVLVRHGQTEWSRTGRHTSSTDLPLLDEGVAQARRVGGLLSERPFAQVLTSPLARARDTCVAAGFGEVAQVTEELTEWDYGALEGLTTPEIRQRLDDGDWSIWTRAVPGGETVGEVGRRADRVIASALAAPGDTLCFGHGHALRVLAARWVGLPAVGGALLALGPGSLSELGWERTTPVLARWNVAV